MCPAMLVTTLCTSLARFSVLAAAARMTACWLLLFSIMAIARVSALSQLPLLLSSHRFFSLNSVHMKSKKPFSSVDREYPLLPLAHLSAEFHCLSDLPY